MNQQLNSNQQKAVDHTEGPLLVLAGAGSGKTRVVTFRILHLLQLGVPFSEILAVTFTNKAAEEMRERIRKLANTYILASTFHSLSARILRESIPALGYPRSFVIYDEDDAEKLLKECLLALNAFEEKGTLRTMRTAISNAKNQLLSPEEIPEEEETLKAVYSLYQARLKSYEALDFDDLLFLSVKLLINFPDILEMYQKRWSFILIDEYQDTNMAQDKLIKLLSAKHRNVFAVGDPDQAIYSWRGASVHHILNFEKDYPGAQVIALEQNYRSTDQILQAANSLISKNPNRYKKSLWSGLGAGEKISLFLAPNDRAEADFVIEKLYEQHYRNKIPLSECVIFYRTNAQSRLFEDALLKKRLPYLILGGLSFYQRREIKDLLALLRMALGGADFISFSRTANIPKRGLGEALLAKLRLLSEEEHVSIFNACQGVIQGEVLFKLSKKQLDGLTEYVKTISSLRVLIEAKIPLHELIRETIKRSRYEEYLKEDPESAQERLENLEELIAKAAEWEEGSDTSLASFLEELSLKSSAESTSDKERVHLMTLHHGKGLEFDTVFLAGMEEDLFPHANVRDNPEGLEEERRLCYVGMTRAKRKLYLTCSAYRFLWGTPRNMRPSRFLAEIPKEYFEAKNGMTAVERDFGPGDSVHHKDFGFGVVKKSYQTSLGLTYDVFFPQTGNLRSLAAKYARLSPAETKELV